MPGATFQALFMRSPVTTLIGFGTGTVIGNQTGGGGNAAAFDGNTSQVQASSATLAASIAGLSNFVGKNWTTTKIITKVIAYSASNSPFLGSGASAYKIQGSTDNFSASIVDLASGTTVGGSAEVLTITGLVVTTAYQYHRFIFTGNGTNSTSCAEVQFFEDI